VREHPLSDERVEAAAEEIVRVEALLEPWKLRSDVCDLPAFFDRNERVYLAFSGGRDSLALLHMCGTWGRDKLSLVWLNTGLQMPEMTTFCRSFADHFDLIELAAPSIPKHWDQVGTPTELMPIETGDRPAIVTPWASCCATNKLLPIADFLRSVKGQAGFLFSHRRTDSTMLAAHMHSMIGPNIEVENPLYAWDDARLDAYLAEHKVPLPLHYRAGVTDSLDCAICPARMTRERMAYLRKHIPQMADAAEAMGHIALREASKAWRATSEVFGDNGRSH
jgi:3'-phosphoadenosine 5'-phosphosulfate sulfotransferase (PAPS reductase)/FAD synthetase